MTYIMKSTVSGYDYRDAEQLVASLKSARREMRAERRKVRRPHV